MRLYDWYRGIVIIAVIVIAILAFVSLHTGG